MFYLTTHSAHFSCQVLVSTVLFLYSLVPNISVFRFCLLYFLLKFGLILTNSVVIYCF